MWGSAYSAYTYIVSQLRPLFREETYMTVHFGPDDDTLYRLI